MKKGSNIWYLCLLLNSVLGFHVPLQVGLTFISPFMSTLILPCKLYQKAKALFLRLSSLHYFSTVFNMNLSWTFLKCIFENASFISFKEEVNHVKFGVHCSPSHILCSHPKVPNSNLPRKKDLKSECLHQNQGERKGIGPISLFSPWEVSNFGIQMRRTKG